MAPGPFSGLLAPFIGARKSKKYEKLQTDDPEKKRQEATQEEINRLHNKIEKLVATMSREELDPASNAEEACVICCAARAVMQVAPCNHQALCRLCFVHTIQEAVAARDLPLKCLLCGSKIIRVKNNSKSGQEMIHPVHVGLGSTNRVKKIPKSVSGYSLCASSETEEQLKNNQRHPSLAQSQSSYSMSSALSSMSSESGRSVTSGRSNVSQKSGVSNSSSWFSIGSLSNFQASRIIDAKTINRPPRAHSLSSRGKSRPRSSASSSSSTLTASSSDLSIKRYANNKDNNGNHDSGSDITTSSGGGNGSSGVDQNNHHSEFYRNFAGSISNASLQPSANTTSNTHLGLYREPRLNKSDSASLSGGLHNNSTNRFQTANHSVPLSPNSIDNRLRAIQISISHDQLNNRTISSNNDDQDLLGSSPPMTLGGQLATQPIMPIITQPRRPSIGRESFRQRNLGCVPQNLVFRGDSAAQIAPNLNIDNCFVLKSQLRRLSGSGKDGQFGRARYTKSPELIETTFSMSTIEEEQEIALSLKSVEG